MLIGNRQRFAFELLPVFPSWERRYGPERAAWAGLSIWVGGENLCRHELPGSTEIHDALFVPLGPMADWLIRVFPALAFEERAALFRTTRRLHMDVERWGETQPPGIEEDDWMDAREGWWSRHFLRAGADGAQIPNVAMVRDDENLVIAWAPPRFASEDAPLMLSREEGQFALPWPEGRAVLEDFVSQVAEWLREADATEPFPWAETPQPLTAASAALPQALELLTGRCLGDLEAMFHVRGIEALLERLHVPSNADDPAASAPCQILRDLSPAVNSDVASLLTDLGQHISHTEPDSLACWHRAREIASDAVRSTSSLVESGQAAAIELRRNLNLEAQPLPEIADFVKQFGLSYAHSHVQGNGDRMVVGAREDGSVAARTLDSTRTEQAWGQRFEGARALGHVLLDPLRAATLGAASGPYAQASRRARSGAFAAECLLPEGALAHASGERLDGATKPEVFQRLMDQYGVGARTCAYQLWNRGWLSSPTVRNELIDQFAAVK